MDKFLDNEIAVKCDFDAAAEAGAITARFRARMMAFHVIHKARGLAPNREAMDQAVADLIKSGAIDPDDPLPLDLFWK